MLDFTCMLQCRQGMYEGQRFELSSGDFIGRSDQCRIVLKDQMISRLHCRLMFIQGSWWVMCFGLNGMTIDGKYFGESYDAIPISSGSVIQINKEVFVVL